MPAPVSPWERGEPGGERKKKKGDVLHSQYTLLSTPVSFDSYFLGGMWNTLFACLLTSFIRKK
jgi:hypothetical protein